MIEDIKDIKRIRKNINITQKQLAESSQVSQSLIAKIESGRIDPAYSKVRKINQALISLTSKNEKKAIDLMNKKIITSNIDDSIKYTIKKMKQYNISQIPVFQDRQLIGIIAEHDILDAITNNFDINEKIEKIINESPPIISKNTGIRIIQELLKQHTLIMVFEKGRYIGLITKVDLLNVY
ncbi:MAG: CBS domain-containing protein [Candidatus Woesearchaeota archaeon]